MSGVLGFSAVARRFRVLGWDPLCRHCVHAGLSGPDGRVEGLGLL